VECFRCRVWLDDFQTKVIDGDDYCSKCAFSVLDIENERLQATNAALLEALELIVDDRGWETIDDARKIATEAIHKARSD
jgi:hypothetical protein